MTRAGGAAEPPRATSSDGWRCPVYDMDGLPPGQEVKGPAIFESATTTVLIRARERAVVTREGWLDITARVDPARSYHRLALALSPEGRGT